MKLTPFRDNFFINTRHPQPAKRALHKSNFLARLPLVAVGAFFRDGWESNPRHGDLIPYSTSELPIAYNKAHFSVVPVGTARVKTPALLYWSLSAPLICGGRQDLNRPRIYLALPQSSPPYNKAQFFDKGRISPCLFRTFLIAVCAFTRCILTHTENSTPPLLVRNQAFIYLNQWEHYGCLHLFYKLTHLSTRHTCYIYFRKSKIGWIAVYVLKWVWVMAVFQGDTLSNELLKVFTVCHFPIQDAFAWISQPIGVGQNLPDKFALCCLRLYFKMHFSSYGALHSVRACLQRTGATM